MYGRVPVAGGCAHRGGGSPKVFGPTFVYCVAPCLLIFTIWANGSVDKNKWGDTNTRTEIETAFTIYMMSLMCIYIKYPPYKVFARVLYNYALHGLHGTAARAPLAACCNAPAQTTDADETEAETGSSQIDLFVYDTKQMGQSHGISSDILSRRLRRPIPTAGLTACTALPPRQLSPPIPTPTLVPALNMPCRARQTERSSCWCWAHWQRSRCVERSRV